MSQARSGVGRRSFLIGAAATSGVAALGARARRAAAQAKPTITYWNGLTGADGKVMDGLIDQFTQETGIRIEQQRIPWADLYAKLQVSVPAGEGPDLALIHTVEIAHFANDGILEVIDEAALGGRGFRGEDYLPATWQGGSLPEQTLLGASRRPATCPLPQRQGDEGSRSRRGRWAASRAGKPRRAGHDGKADG